MAVLCGKLLYCSNVIFAGRLSQPTVLTQDFFEDIKWWISAIELRNGISFLVRDAETHVSLDASSNAWYGGKPSLGGYNHTVHQYFSYTVPDKYADWCIANLELLATYQV